MPRTGLLLGNVNGSQCIIWDDPAIQVKREISVFSIWKAGKNVTFHNNNDIQSRSFYLRGIYQVFCKLQGIISFHLTSLKNPGWRYGTCYWIYCSWRMLWKFHEIPKDALHLSDVFVFVLAFAHQCFRCIDASFFQTKHVQVLYQSPFSYSESSFPRVLLKSPWSPRWQVKPMLFPEFWAPIGGFAGRQLPAALQLERVEVKVPFGKVFEKMTWFLDWLMTSDCLYQTVEFGGA